MAKKINVYRTYVSNMFVTNICTISPIYYIGSQTKKRISMDTYSCDICLKNNISFILAFSSHFIFSLISHVWAKRYT